MSRSGACDTASEAISVWSSSLLPGAGRPGDEAVRAVGAQVDRDRALGARAENRGERTGAVRRPARLEPVGVRLPPSEERDEADALRDACRVGAGARVAERRERASELAREIRREAVGGDVVRGRPRAPRP